MNATLSRRNFLTGTVAAAGMMALGSMAGLSASAEKSEKNRVCEILGIEKPVIQANMSQLTSPELAAAVSNAGGLGIIAVAAGDQFRADVQKLKSLTDKPFGVEFSANDDTIAMLQEEGVKIVFFLGLGGKDGGLLGNGDYNVDADGIKKAKDAGVYVIGYDRLIENTDAVTEFHYGRSPGQV